MKTRPLLSVFVALCAVNGALGATCEKISCADIPNGSLVTRIDRAWNGCFTTENCYYYLPRDEYARVSFCSQCPVAQSYSMIDTSLSIIGCTAGFEECACQCTPACSDGTWQGVADGYERRVENKCDCTGAVATCKPVITDEYRCAAGYYGNPTNGATGCTKCRDGYSSHAGNAVAEADCYLAYCPAGYYGTPQAGYTDDNHAGCTPCSGNTTSKSGDNRSASDCFVRCCDNGYWGLRTGKDGEGCGKCPAGVNGEEPTSDNNYVGGECANKSYTSCKIFLANGEYKDEAGVFSYDTIDTITECSIKIQ